MRIDEWGKERRAFHPGQECSTPTEPYTFAQTNPPHPQSSLAEQRRNIHSDHATREGHTDVAGSNMDGQVND